MRLLLSMLGWPDGANPDLREIDGELAIGRGREAEWMLPDPGNQLSRRHCVLTPFGQGWRITDLSLNGTFINESHLPLGRQQSHELHDGDRFRIGAYVIEARYQAPPSLADPMADHHPFGVTQGGAHPPAGHAWPGDAWATPVTGGFAAGLDGHRSATLDGFVGQPAADHSLAVSDAWQAPPPSRLVIPDDWDLEEVSPVPQMVPAVNPPPPILPTPPMVTQAESWGDDQTLHRPATPHAGLSNSVLLEAFLRGAGLRDIGDADPTALMESVGKTLRVLVDRLREVHAARGTIKREFRILATAVQPDDNNPIKFSPSDEAALRSLLDGKYPPERAVGELLDDIRLHELAMIAAMRDGVNGLLAELDPAPLRAADQGLAGMLPIQRRARAFDQYEALHARTVQALADDFDSVFGKAFARAYERVALDEVNRPRRTRR